MRQDYERSLPHVRTGARSPFAGAAGTNADQVLGPFYPFMHEPSCGGDLTALPGRRHQAQGQIIHVMGRVSDRYGTPVRDAKLIIWQANAFGRYSHPNDLSEAPLDPNFEGFGVISTDDDGRYHLKTIKPGGYLA